MQLNNGKGRDVIPEYQIIKQQILKAHQVDFDNLPEAEQMRWLLDSPKTEILPNLDLGIAKIQEGADYNVVVGATGLELNGDESIKNHAGAIQLPIMAGDTDVGVEGFSHENQQPLREALKRVDQALANGERVYVCCQQGKDRSALFILCYLVAKYEVTPEQAFTFVQSKRPIITTNEIPKYWDFLEKDFDADAARAHLGSVEHTHALPEGSAVAPEPESDNKSDLIEHSSSESEDIDDPFGSSFSVSDDDDTPESSNQIPEGESKWRVLKFKGGKIICPENICDLDKNKVNELIAAISELNMVDPQTPEEKACNALYKRLIFMLDEALDQLPGMIVAQISDPMKVFEEMILAGFEAQYRDDKGKEHSALEVASHNSSFAQKLLNVLACIVTLGYGLVKGIKNYNERGQFDTGVGLFKIKNDTGHQADEIKLRIQNASGTAPQKDYNNVKK